MKNDIQNFIETLEDFKKVSLEKCKVADDMPLNQKIIVERNEAAVRLFSFVISALKKILKENECVSDCANRQVKTK